MCFYWVCPFKSSFFHGYPSSYHATELHNPLSFINPLNKSLTKQFFSAYSQPLQILWPNALNFSQDCSSVTSSLASSQARFACMSSSPRRHLLSASRAAPHWSLLQPGAISVAEELSSKDLLWDSSNWHGCHRSVCFFIIFLLISIRLMYNRHSSGGLCCDSLYQSIARGRGSKASGISLILGSSGMDGSKAWGKQRLWCAVRILVNFRDNEIVYER